MEQQSANLASMLRFCAYVLNTSPTTDALASLEEASRLLPGGADFWDEAAGRDTEQVSMELRVDWTRLFRGLSPDYGPKPPYELLFNPQGGGEVPALLEAKRRYERAGLRIDEGAHNRPDYLGFELEFAAYLLEEGQDAASFVSEHLSWAPAFCEQAQGHAKTAFYRWYLDLLAAVCGEAAGLIEGA